MHIMMLFYIVIAYLITEDADAAWDSVRSVSNQGRKRGRASRNKMMKRVDLYAGLKFGQGITAVDLI